MVALKVVDHLHNGRELAGRVVQDGAVRRRHNVVPLGRAVFLGGELCQRRMVVLNAKPHGSHCHRLFHPVADVPEHGIAPEVRAVESRNALGSFSRQKDRFLSVCQCRQRRVQIFRDAQLRPALQLRHGNGWVEHQVIGVADICVRQRQDEMHPFGALQFLRHPAEDAADLRQTGFRLYRECPLAQGVAVFPNQHPFCRAGLGQNRSHGDLCHEHFAGNQHIGRELCQQHTVRAEHSPFLRRDQPLAVHECVQHSHQRRSLTGEILEIQQLESGDILRAHCRLDLFLIAGSRQCAAAPEELVRLAQHSLCTEPEPENLEVPGFQRSGVLVDLPEVGIDLVLSDLVGDHRLGGNESAGSLAHLHLFHAGAVLDLDLFRVGCALALRLLGKDHVVILVHGAGALCLDVTQRCVAHPE